MKPEKNTLGITSVYALGQKGWYRGRQQGRSREMNLHFKVYNLRTVLPTCMCPFYFIFKFEISLLFYTYILSYIVRVKSFKY